MGDNNFKDLFSNLGKMNIPKIESIVPKSYEMFNPNRKEYHSPEEILEEDKEEFERPDFSEWTCKTCNDSIGESYFWYYLRHETDECKSIVTCSKECLDEFVNNHNCSDYEIYEYSRCSAYFKCKEIGNLRNMCETVENKTYRSIIPMVSINHCQPAQAGVILSTHKLTEVLMDFSKQTEEQFLSNKKMMKQSAKESSKQFKITTWMTVLVIILTIVNLIPSFVDRSDNDYSEQLASIEARIDESSTVGKLNGISEKLDDIIRLLNNVEDINDDRNISRVLKQLESIERRLNSDGQ